MSTMSIVQGQPPSYSETQVISNLVGVSDPSLLTLTNARIPEPAQEEADPSPEDAANLDLFKQKIYRHPLFPLLAMVFEKCEAATYFPDTSSHSFEKELKAFMKHHEGLESPLMDGEEEVNQLMLKAIQVLRIHLMEVEKVNELCKDFCARYIGCLKSKLTSDSLLHVEGCDSPPPSSENSPTPGMMTLSPSIQVQPAPVTPSVIGGGVVLQQPQQQPQIVSGNTVYQMVRTPQGIVAQPIQIQGPLTPLNQPPHQAIHGSTPLSQVGLTLSSPPVQQQQQQHQQQAQQQAQSLSNPVPQNLSTHASKKALNLTSQNEDGDEEEKNGKQKRGVLPKQATQIMRSWLFQHIMHPYPTEDEKRQIASQTNLTLLQVNNWFINARRRILQPMLEVSNPDKSKAKKTPKSPAKPQHRFWPVQSESSSMEAAASQLIKTEEREGPKDLALSSTSSNPPADRVMPSISMECTTVPQPEALMGLMPNTNLVLKLGPDGQIVPSTQVAVPNPQSITLESLQALQSSGLFLTPGASPMPLHLPFNSLTPVGGAAGLGMGMGTFPGLAAAASIMNLNAAAAAAAAYTPLQSANMNPIDLSTMSSSAPIQLNTLVNGAANAQLLMGLAYQGAGGELMERRDGGLENGELCIDTDHGMTDVAN